MCDWCSWIKKDGKIYYLTDDMIAATVRYRWRFIRLQETIRRTNMTRYEQLEKKKQLCFDAMWRVDNLEAQIIWSRHYRDLDTIQKSLTITEAERVVQC